jgi:RND family efflux transporter MFP subunit
MARASVLIVLVAALSGVARAEPLGCLIQPFQEAEIGSQVVGVLEKVNVERGDLVKKGQPLAQLQSDVERAALLAAKSKADATAELQAAASNNDFAQKKKVRTKDLYQQNFVSQQATDQAATEAELAKMRLQQAREQLKVAQHELALANAQLSQRTVRSPLSGVVVEKYLSEGERVEEKPIVKVAMVDPLRVEVIVPAVHFGKVKLGQVATVKPDLTDMPQQSAKVIVVDRVIDPASNSFRVRLELPNPDNALPPGLRCKVDFEFAATAAAKPEEAAGHAAPKPAAVNPKPANPPAANAKPANPPAANAKPPVASAAVAQVNGK